MTFVFRPIEESDHSQLVDLVYSIKSGITSLPKDSDFLYKRIQQSVKSFSSDIKEPDHHYYFFVLEDIENKKIAGVSGLYASCAPEDRYYALVRGSEKHYSEQLGIETHIDYLKYQKLTNPPSEVCSLYLRKEYRNRGCAPLLVLARYLFIAGFRHRFRDKIIARLRGYRNKSGVSPFWNGVMKPFFYKKELDFDTIDSLQVTSSGEFVNELIPKHPLYIHCLPTKIQNYIGRVHPHTRPALHFLERQGYLQIPKYDIFDAGPYYQATMDEVHAIKYHKKAHLLETTKEEHNLSKYIIANNSIQFRACIGRVNFNEEGNVSISNKIAELLLVKNNDIISFLSL